MKAPVKPPRRTTAFEGIPLRDVQSLPTGFEYRVCPSVYFIDHRIAFDLQKIIDAWIQSECIDHGISPVYLRNCMKVYAERIRAKAPKPIVA